jgi:hypothetical protein
MAPVNIYYFNFFYNIYKLTKKSKYVPKTLEEDLERGVSESSESDYYSSDSDNELTFG